MKISTTYHRPDPDTVMGHKIILTQVYYSMDRREINIIEGLFKAQYGSGTITECKITESEEQA